MRTKSLPDATLVSMDLSWCLTQRETGFRGLLGGRCEEDRAGREKSQRHLQSDLKVHPRAGVTAPRGSCHQVMEIVLLPFCMSKVPAEA